MTQSKHAKPRDASGRRETAPKRSPLRNLVTLPLLLAAVVAVIALATMEPAPEAPPPPPEVDLTAADLPSPWEYIQSTDQHWHPGHQHFHQGPPPPDRRPAPWTYDQQRNQHWVEEHLHWHPGPPPAPEERQQAPAAPSQHGQAPGRPDPQQPEEPDGG